MRRQLRKIPLRPPTIIMIVSLVVSLVLVGTVATLVSRGKATDGRADTAAERAQEAARDARTVRRERARSIRISCQQTNGRNHRAKMLIWARVPRGPGRDFSLLLIDTAIPRQNCEALVKRRVSGL